MRVKRPRVALAALFFGFGVLDGTWAARLPAVKARLELDTGELGIALFALTAAAVAILPVAGSASARRGSREIAAGGVVVACAGLVLAGHASSFALLVVAAVVMGAGFGLADVAGNAHGVAVERRIGRPVLTSFHAMWSFGLLAGSAGAAAAAAAGASPPLHFAVVAGAVAVATLVARGGLLAAADDVDVQAQRFALPRGALTALALICFCAMFVEAGAANWAAVFVAGPVGASGAVAAGAVAAYSVAMAVARLVGDRLTTRWGAAALTRRGSLLAAGGLALALASRSPLPALIGFACVGAGVAAVVPVVFRAGGSVAGIAPGAGIAAVATIGYNGGVVNGPVVGFAARGVGLTLALVLVVVACVVMAALASRVPE